MDLRRVCNVVYAHLTGDADPERVRYIDALLAGESPRAPAAGPRLSAPAAGPVADEAGTRALMAAMMLPQKP